MTSIYNSAGVRAGRPLREIVPTVVVALYALAATIAGALGLLAATSAPLQFRIDEAPRAVSQYCVPTSDSMTAYRVYCRYGQG
jgi:hypothetical protein